MSKRAAYFPNAESQQYQWHCDGVFVCSRCGGLTCQEGGDPRHCLVCDGPDVIKIRTNMLIELGALRERTKVQEKLIATLRRELKAGLLG